MKKPLLFLTLGGLGLLVAILLLTLPARPAAQPIAEETPAQTATPPPVQAASETPSPTMTATNTPSPTVTLAASQLGTRVTFTAKDGRELVGYFYPAWKPNAPIVVLMHQYGNRQAAWNESAIIPWMQNWGAQDATGQAYTYAGGRLPQMPNDVSFAVLTFDFRGHGESLPNLLMADFSQNAPLFLMDARAAYAFAATLPGVDPNRVIGIGASIGADAVVDACDSCAGAFSVSPGNWLGVDYGEAAQPILARGRPVRCMYAVSDGDAPKTCWSLAPGDLYMIFAYPGIKHGMTFFIPRKMEAGFGQNLLDFLQAASQ
jgi:pimeloyl-ACP methyl ester carboxylesterase